ncbi:hypothetical protein KC19_1G222600 [Ceratodon purpureus]|uniref:Uncharacterized protein n=1 Tax=Ceratodon purpureus TaxID=3225 RepID=A0A8T0J839_CERPU|nr:hypothetical protein KC19_1G222600 [Ceratodon purpureus]
MVPTLWTLHAIERCLDVKMVSCLDVWTHPSLECTSRQLQWSSDHVRDGVVASFREPVEKSGVAGFLEPIFVGRVCRVIVRRDGHEEKGVGDYEIDAN